MLNGGAYLAPVLEIAVSVTLRAGFFSKLNDSSLYRALCHHPGVIDVGNIYMTKNTNEKDVKLQCM